MIVLDIVIFLVALTLVALLTLQQTIVFVREYRFYERRGWDFSVDSGLDRIDERISPYALQLTSRQRLLFFRPLYLAMLVTFMGGMIWLGVFS